MTDETVDKEEPILPYVNPTPANYMVTYTSNEPPWGKTQRLFENVYVSTHGGMLDIYDDHSYSRLRMGYAQGEWITVERV